MYCRPTGSSDSRIAGATELEPAASCATRVTTLQLHLKKLPRLRRARQQVRIGIYSGQIGIQPVLFECLSRAPHLNKKDPILLVRTSEQLIAKASPCNSRPLTTSKSVWRNSSRWLASSLSWTTTVTSCAFTEAGTPLHPFICCHALLKKILVPIRRSHRDMD